MELVKLIRTVGTRKKEYKMFMNKCQMELRKSSDYQEEESVGQSCSSIMAVNLTSFAIVVTNFMKRTVCADVL